MKGTRKQGLEGWEWCPKRVESKGVEKKNLWSKEGGKG